MAHQSVSFNASIYSCIELAFSYEILMQAGSRCSLNASKSFKMMSRSATEYRELYDTGVNNQDFNLLIFDGSFFQFSLHGEDIRLAFYPNPYTSLNKTKLAREAKELLERGSLTSTEYEQIISEEVFHTEIPPIRFDYSKIQYHEDYHPCAHFHVGFHSDNRWPSKLILTPQAFFLKIIRLYYLDKWKTIAQDIKVSHIHPDILYTQELNKCSFVNSNFFTVDEESRLYIT